MKSLRSDQVRRLLRQRPILILLSALAIFATFGAALFTLQARPASAASNAPILFIHGFNKDSPPKVNCAASSQAGTFIQYMRQKKGFTGEITTIGYYRDDTCDVNLSAGTNAVNPGPGRCLDEQINGIPVTGTTANDVGTINESLVFLGCKLSWYIYDGYTSQGINVRVFAHSMGGMLIRWALHCVSMNMTNLTHSYCNGYPPKLDVSEVVSVATPHGGVPDIISSAYWACGGCTQVSQLQSSVFLTELENDTAGGRVPGGHGYGTTDWTLMSSDCDSFIQQADPGVDTIRAMSFPGVSGVPGTHKFVYRYITLPMSSAAPPHTHKCGEIPDPSGSGAPLNEWDYTHGDYLQDPIDSTDAGYSGMPYGFCDGCSDIPGNTIPGQPHALQVVYNALDVNLPIPPTPTPPPPPPAGYNFIVNGTFAGGSTAGWIGSGPQVGATFDENRWGDHTGDGWYRAHWLNTPYNVTTSQPMINMPAGYYQAKAWFMAGCGSATTTFTLADTVTGASVSTTVPCALASWTQITLPPVQITSGRGTLSVTTNSPTNASQNDWIRFDDVEVKASAAPPPPPTPTPTPPPPPTVLVVNGGFESGGTGWQVWAGASGANGGASYNEAKWGGHNGTPWYRAHWKGSAYDVSTYQDITLPTTGDYLVSAWVETSCSDNTNFAVKNNNTNTYWSVQAVARCLGGWTNIQLPTFHANAGTSVRIEFYSNNAANEWLRIDDVSLVKVSATCQPGQPCPQ